MIDRDVRRDRHCDKPTSAPAPIQLGDDFSV